MFYISNRVITPADEFVRLIDAKVGMILNITINKIPTNFVYEGLYSCFDKTPGHSSYSKNEPRYAFTSDNAAESMMMYISDGVVHIEIRNTVSRVIEYHQAMPAKLGLTKKGGYYGFMNKGKAKPVGDPIQIGDTLVRTKSSGSEHKYEVKLINHTGIVCQIGDDYRSINWKETSVLEALGVVYIHE